MRKSVIEVFLYWKNRIKAGIKHKKPVDITTNWLIKEYEKKTSITTA